MIYASTNLISAHVRGKMLRRKSQLADVSAKQFFPYKYNQKEIFAYDMISIDDYTFQKRIVDNVFFSETLNF